MTAGRTALVLVDLQHWITGMPWAPRDGAAVLEAAARLRAALTGAGADASPQGPLYVAVRHLHADGSDGGADAPANALHPEAAPGPDDLLVTKHGLDAFEGTGLREGLDRLGVTDLVLAGLSTAHGVAATARSAVAAGYRVTVVSDATASVSHTEHDQTLAALETLGARIGTVESETAGR
ncbi:cysteine hydrolase [Kitasatospora sp. NBC_00240]|uniref:cysteine hydrolase family protein n=1 Tax=Kitasatospora sp. NBC_00240 TaxID=2903567 RepID=UPI00224E4E86|nr:cysteine hydrolase [Kitasatospora sp. NBC_00240]MCX5214485.1 cysteine hydrolase [Kitasatospora sp. NBC_00240]